mmetsp:Transcript_71211/g.164651  ORF Transcript_71211/g.164651 Transcript_71211/m.164651 type:complete len:218 (-) Transcript_71211:379-1032(-)
MQLVKYHRVAEIDGGQLMMQIVHVRLTIHARHPRPLVPAVVRLCPKDCVRNPAVHGEDVEAEEADAAHEGPQVRHHHLNGPAVDCCEREGSCVLVVLLVKLAVELLVMQQPVDIVEHQLVPGKTKQEATEVFLLAGHVEMFPRASGPGIVGHREVHEDEQDHRVDRQRLRQLPGLQSRHVHIGLDLEWLCGLSCPSPQIEGQEHEPVDQVRHIEDEE